MMHDRLLLLALGLLGLPRLAGGIDLSDVPTFLFQCRFDGKSGAPPDARVRMEWYVSPSTAEKGGTPPVFSHGAAWSGWGNFSAREVNRTAQLYPAAEKDGPFGAPKPSRLPFYESFVGLPCKMVVKSVAVDWRTPPWPPRQRTAAVTCRFRPTGRDAGHPDQVKHASLVVQPPVADATALLRARSGGANPLLVSTLGLVLARNRSAPRILTWRELNAERYWPAFHALPTTARRATRFPIVDSELSLPLVCTSLPTPSHRLQASWATPTPEHTSTPCRPFRKPVITACSSLLPPGLGCLAGVLPPCSRRCGKEGRQTFALRTVPCTVDLSRTRLCSLPVMIFICRCRCELTHAETSAQEV